jgi:ubiquinone/menaquinone biosynthesis C-methylase UbiE
MNIYTAERTNENSVSDNPIYQRHLFAYQNAVQYIKGDVLEVGCGEGYGSKLLAPHAKKYTAIDKFKATNEHNLQGIEFIQMNVPYLKPFADNAFDAVISFQVIEHIQRDDVFVQEICRVLKPGGLFVCTTPNIKMSLSRNPYHIREYTVQQLADLIKKTFPSVDPLGIFCDQKAMDYFERNRESVRKFTRFDVFNLQYNLPRWALKIPYDIFNRMNRLRLNKENAGLVSEITTANFMLKRARDSCIDLFYVAQK